MSDVESRERIATLEADFRHMSGQLDDMSRKVSDMHDLLMQAKGARYIVLASAAIAGAITGFSVKFIPWLSTFPK